MTRKLLKRITVNHKIFWKVPAAAWHLIRVLVEDDEDQANAVRKTVTFAEKNSIQILILPEVLLETVWVLESVYGSSRDEIFQKASDKIP